MKVIGQVFKYATLLVLSALELACEMILGLVKALKGALDKH